MSSQDWLTNIEPGDTVVISGHAGCSGTINKVVRLTKTMITVGDREIRFNRKNGWGVGDYGYHKPHLMEPTPKLLERIKRENLVNGCAYHCNKNNLKKLDTEDLVIIANIIKKVRE